MTRLRVMHFRNYSAADVAPCEGVTVFYGDNAQGKTSLLEAVALCCMGRSHKTPRDRELIQWGQPIANVCVETLHEDGPHEVSMCLQANARKLVKVGGNPIARSGELLGHVRGVLFAPEDLRTVKDGPAERRRFVDMELSQIHPAYYYDLQRYGRALDQRNHLLRDIALGRSPAALLEPWNEQLVACGARIMAARSAFCQRLSIAAHENHLEISGGRERLTLAYRPSVTEREGDDSLASAISRSLREAREQDIRRATTTAGPHRDDLQLNLDGMDVRAYGSQGQQRTTALSLKLSELSVMREETGEWPVLMLDDVMSELDPLRRRQLIGRLRGVQVLVTCTDLKDLADAQIGAAYLIRAGVVCEGGGEA